MAELESYIKIFQRSGMVVASGSIRFNSYRYDSDNTIATYVTSVVKYPFMR